MPFGLMNTSVTFQKLINYILYNYLNDFIIIYLDDILICLDTFEEYLAYLRKIFTKL